MSRSGRLLELLQNLRRHRWPVAGRVLAGELGVSLRTLYRDIESLKAQGADIEGEPGLGYVLRPGFLLPPLMLTEEEIEALVLGSRWVARHAGDARLSLAAGQALAKIAAVLPAELQGALETSPLLVGLHKAGSEPVDISSIRRSIRAGHKIDILYQDAGGAASRRLVWPFALGFFETVRVVIAWCEMRQDFRHFRVDRIQEFSATGERYPRRRQVLLSEWRARIEAPEPP